MTLGTLTVGNGAATLQSSAAMSLKTATIRGDITARSVGNMLIGSVTSQTGDILAKASAGALTFTSFVAYSDVTISGYAASSSLSAITGTTLTASTGGVDVGATKGKVTVRTISARTPSIIKLDDGSLAVSSILALTRPNLTVQVQGGTSTLPRGF